MVETSGLRVISTGQPTYWPTDRNKVPDLIDFFMVKGFSENYFVSSSSLELSSDHSPVLATLSSEIMLKPRKCTLHNNKTDWNRFRDLLTTTLNTKISLKSVEDIEDVEYFNSSLQKAAWDSSPTHTIHSSRLSYSNSILEKVAAKRKLRKQWQPLSSNEKQIKSPDKGS